MKIEYYHIQDAISAALHTAVVAVAWPKLVSALQNGATDPSESGTFSIPIGHYFKLPADDHMVTVAVTLSAREFTLQGGPHYPAGGELCEVILGALQGHVQNKDMRTALGPCRKVDELAAIAGKRYSVSAVASLAITSRQKTVAELTAEKLVLTTALTALETKYPQDVAAATATHEQRKQALDSQHTQALAQIANADPVKIANENLAYEQRKQQASSSYTQSLTGLQKTFEQKKSGLDAEIAYVDTLLAEAAK